MAEQALRSDFPLQPEAELRRNEHQPKGVLQKNLKLLIYLGAAVLVILAAMFSASGKRSKSQPSSARHDAPQPALQDNTDNNVQDLKNQLAQERQREAQMEAAARSQESMPAERAIGRIAVDFHRLWAKLSSCCVCAGSHAPSNNTPMRSNQMYTLSRR